jgi:amino acid permease
MSNQRINRVSSRIILGLSFFAMFLVGGAAILTMLGRLNPSPGGDEGTPAHLFQLAVGLLFPAGLVFLVTADWRRPLKVAKQLVLPAVALVVAFSLLYYMEHLPWKILQPDSNMFIILMAVL